MKAKVKNDFCQNFFWMGERHIIYVYKGKVRQASKKWTFAHCEEVLTRLGATYWEIG